ncbi:FAD-binding oxidoreductase [Streptomyces sp. NBC_00568]|uniref:FAD-binding oxidoreductase n=1 Tax=Streptomyces sp. NBC_00568 TaxID=2975779 RepID=UPI002259D711|nr:FAD-binding oxidoreductase [Streptomyces sp. NBC_00568]MCX4993607.1 FAD-binding oxidoreductase [Streptomyces sp. NBC_00568]
MQRADGSADRTRISLPDSLAAVAVRPEEPGYEHARHTYLHRGSPAAVLQVGNAQDIAAALDLARDRQLPLSVRSGGHGISGRSTNDGGIVVDLARLNRVEVLNSSSRLVRVEAGARWGSVAAALAPYSLAVSSGDTGDVGVGGLATAGGIGLLSRRHGLTIDHVQAVELVLHDGTPLRVDADNHPDLFWAMRGAGANYGIATAFEFEAEAVDEVLAAVTLFDASDSTALLTRWGAALEAAPRQLTSFLTLFAGRNGGRPVAQAMSVYAGTNIDAATAALTPVLAAGPVLNNRAALTQYHDLLPASHVIHRAQQPLSVSRSGLLQHITTPVAELLGSAVGSGAATMVQLRSIGGAVNDMPTTSTAYPHRTQNFALMAATLPVHEAILDRHWDQVEPTLHGLYSSFETRTGHEQLEAAFPGAVLERLRILKAKYDPNQVFCGNFAIPPAPSPANR